jgi:hypothetical protein
VTVVPPVPLDIKPGSCPNPLNVADEGVTPVAILGTNDFDVNQIDPATVRLEGVAPIQSALQDVSSPFAPLTGKSDCLDCTKGKKDKMQDLVLKFKTQEIVEALGAVVPGECRVLRLTAGLQGGGMVIGEDVVRIQTSTEKESDVQTVPDGVSLYSYYPNPFNPETQIQYDLQDPVHARLVIYDVLGHEVKVLVDEVRPAGLHEVLWDGKDRNGLTVTSGVYYCRLTAGDVVQTLRLLLVR